MVYTSVAPQQTFWDRIPNATSKLAILGRSNQSQKNQACMARNQQAIGPKTHADSASSSTMRINKRKQLHPVRSLQSPATPCTVASNDTIAGSKNRRFTATQSSQQVPVHTQRNKDEHGDCWGMGTLSRAFNLSYADDYSRNPHQYVQALIVDRENSSLGPTTMPSHAGRTGANRHSRPGAGVRSGMPGRIRDTQAARSPGGSVKPTGSGSRRNGKGGRFHNLQVEQTMSENDDAASATTTTSYTNDLADVDSQVPDTPARNRLRLVAKAEAEAEEMAAAEDSDASRQPTPEARSPKNTEESEAAAGDLDNDLDEDEGGTPGSQQSPTTPLLAQEVLAADNMPSYRHMGQELQDDVTLITPPVEKSTVRWTKAEPIDISDRPLADRLAPAEYHCCSVLRILPEQYIAIKQTLLREGSSRSPGSFKKRDAQRLCRIDVNKTSKIYEWFVTIGWLPAGSGIYARPV
ncbi:hypothetical protein GGI07_002700 [Coemansia sp. Benny D115]|nr:hypothetical protein GGI07_002700 [Coemansia sp. Benny D115]